MINIIKMLLLLGKGPGELGIQEETFNNPPFITIFSISQNIHETLIHNKQPVETFNNPPSVSSFSLTQIVS